MKQGLFFWLLIVFVALVGIFSMPKEEYIADPMAVRCETVSLINNGSLAIPASVAVPFGERGQFFVENVMKQKWYCKYGIFNSLIYLPILGIQKWKEGSLEYFSPTRVIYLNVFNLVLAIASAVYLFLITSRYTKREVVAFFYVVAALYTTYWWNYLRAHNSEIYQVLFMLGFYYHLVCSFDGLPSRRQEFLSGLFFSALILTKVVYVILLPVVGLFFILVHDQKSRDEKSLFSLCWWRSLFFSLWSFGFPVALALLTILWVNNDKFGSPFESGYSQWQERGKPILSGSFFSGLSHFFFDPQYSIFIYFPLLAFALFGYSSFFKKFRIQTYLFLSIGLVILLVNAKLLTWSGAWGYGPRYLLVMLPLVSLPFLMVLEWIVYQWKNIKAILAGAFIAFVLLVSLKLQMNVNALPFFVNFRLQGALSSLNDPQIDHYFSSTPFGLINEDLLAFKQGAPLPILKSAEEQLSPEVVERLHYFIKSQLASNYYWF
jgi:hypothetical protein